MKIIHQNISLSEEYVPISIDKLKVGNYLVFNLYFKKNDEYSIVIESGTFLSETLYKKLSHQKELLVARHDEHKHKLSCSNLRDFIHYNDFNPEQNLHFIYAINNTFFQEYLNSQDDKIDVKCAEEIVHSVIYLITNSTNFIKKTVTLFLNKHDLPTHSIHVCLYSIHIGTLLKMPKTRLLELGLASLLHDVGIKKIDKKIIEKNDLLSLEELEQIHEHSALGVDIIKANNIHDPFVIDAILHHHENYDGSGYPDKLECKNISPFTSVISIADTFDTLTSDRPYKKANNSFHAFKIMKEEIMQGKLNQRYFTLFVKSI